MPSLASDFPHFRLTVGHDRMLLHAPDGTPRLGAAFASELQQLRLKQGHTTLTTLEAGAALPAGRCTELLVEFEPAPDAKSSYGVEVVGGSVTILYDPIAKAVRPSPCVGRGPGNDTAALECLLPLALSPLEPIVMHIYIDEGFVEASVNKQSIVMLSSVSSSNASKLLGAVAAARVDAWALDPNPVVQPGPAPPPPPPPRPAPVPAPVVTRAPLSNTDLGPGGGAAYRHIYKNFTNQTVGMQACQAECDTDSHCAAWTYITGTCSCGPQRCCLLPKIGCPLHKTGAISGAKKSSHCDPGKAPAPPGPRPPPSPPKQGCNPGLEMSGPQPGKTAEWRASMLQWRQICLAELRPNGKIFEQLKWARTAYVQPLVMPFDRFFYNETIGDYTPESWLASLPGGADSCLLWPTYPNLGVDSRNQFDLIASMPGESQQLLNV